MAERTQELINMIRTLRTQQATALIANGTDVNARDEYGNTSLHAAAVHGLIGIVRLLLDAGAEINAVDKSNLTVLHRVARGGKVKGFVSPHTNMEIFKVLLASGANVNAESDTKYTPLHWAVYDGLTDNVLFLLENGANVEARNWEGKTPFYIAIEEKHLDIAQILLDYSARVNTTSRTNWTPLHTSMFENRHECTRFLIEHGALIDASNDVGETSLHFAARHNNVEGARMLLENGANVHAAANLQTSRFIAARFWGGTLDGFADVLKTNLYSDLACIAPLHVAVEELNLQVAQLLLDYGADVNIPSFGGYTPLLLAMQFTHNSKMLELLIHNGASVNQCDSITSTKEGGRTALHWAAIYHNTDAVQLLLMSGANPNIHDIQGKIPLDYVPKAKKYKSMVAQLKSGDCAAKG